MEAVEISNNNNVRAISTYFGGEEEEEEEDIPDMAEYNEPDSIIENETDPVCCYYLCCCHRFLTCSNNPLV